MTNTKSTKRALMTSVLALLLCFAMLLGTTWAWFTDSVTSKGNIIQTGSLDVEMYWADGAKEVPAVGDAAWIDASTGAMFNSKLWEPGYTEAKHILIANNGTLAFNYQLRIVANGTVSKLADVIDVYYFADAKQLTRADVETGTKLGTLADILGTAKNLSKTVFGGLEAGAIHKLTLVLKMQETAGNEYQNLSIGTDFSVELIATQRVSESDSFGNDYDAVVPSPELPAALVRPLDDLTIDTTGSMMGTDLGKFELAAGYQFEPTETLDEALMSEYKYWHADFAISADRDVPVNSIVLAGYYDAWCSLNNDKWVAFTSSETVKANTEIRLVQSIACVTYKDLCNYGNDGIGFQCGVGAVDEEAYVALAGTTITVELRMYETEGEWSDSSHTHTEVASGNYITIGTFTYTFPKYIGSSEEFEAEMNKDVENIVVELTSDVTYDVAAWDNEAMGGASTKTVVINSNGHTITFNQTNSDWNNIVITDGAKLIINDAHLTNSGHNNGPWNRHDLNFACTVELNNVTSDKAMAFKSGATLKNVKINDANTSDTYAIWIQPNGQTIDIDGLEIDMLACSDGRGIKIDNQYVTSSEKAVTLNIKNATFKTEEKSAILVKSTKGATINVGENVNIAGVATDSINAVWVDEATAAYADKVVVTGANKLLENYYVTNGMSMDAAGNYYVTGSVGMVNFAKLVNESGKNFSGKTVYLTGDVDLKGIDWEPIGQTGNTTFAGNFDGQGYTISNLTIDSFAETGEHYSSGLFGWVESPSSTISNINVTNATVTGNHNVAVIVGYLYGDVVNCHVTNATIVCKHANDDACGDKAGVIVGYAGPAADSTYIKNCSATDCSVTAGRDAGQLIGCGYKASVSGCTATKVTVTATGDCTGANINNAIIGRVMD